MIDEVGWMGGVMSALRHATDLVWANLAILLGVLAGGVVFGVAPTIVAGTWMVANRDDEPHRWRSFWSLWRRSWAHSNLVFAPVWLIGASCWLDWQISVEMSSRLALGSRVGLIVVGAWTIVAIAHLPVIHDRSFRRAWAAMVLAPLLSLARTGLIVVATVGVGLVASLAPITIVLIAPATLLWIWAAIVRHGTSTEDPSAETQDPNRPESSQAEGKWRAKIANTS
ncbi:MAG: DUF624 domain-containing protein [Propionibacteriaceae bacterium]|jgi:uncharacterized membrane protein YesL|nr:DUF624 domain-containing protein [Propionibacteriaceae bacterium]